MNQTRKWGRASNLGGSQLSTICHYEKDGFLASVICAMMQTVVSIGGFAFVDDTDLCGSGHPTVEQTATHMQQLIRWKMVLPTHQSHPSDTLCL